MTNESTETSPVAAPISPPGDPMDASLAGAVDAVTVLMKKGVPGALERFGELLEEIRGRRLERAGVPTLDVARAKRG